MSATIPLKTVRSIEWTYIVNRRETLLHKSMADCASPYIPSTTGIRWNPKWLLRTSEGGLYHKSDDIRRLMDIFSSYGVVNFRRFQNRLIDNVGRLDKLSERLGRNDYTSWSNKDLAATVRQFIGTVLRAYAFLTVMPVADRALTRMILGYLPPGSAKRQQEWLHTLIYPTRQNEHTKEMRDFYRMYLAIRSTPEQKERLFARHVARYAWIGARWYQWHEHWTGNDLEKRFDDVKKKDVSDELRHLESLPRRSRAMAAELERQLGIDKNPTLMRIIRRARDFAFLRTWRTDVAYRSSYRARNLFYEIARRSGMTPEDVIYCSHFEILEMAKHMERTVTAAEITGRKVRCTTVMLNGHWMETTDPKMCRAISSIVASQHQGTSVHGDTAYKGCVRGTVRRVLMPKDCVHVRRGDILVAVMTFPQFVPAMHRAAAFVTDEGGILCHAAIIARELRKPCIIGTKTATKTFKDGDMVEVDANKGIIRKL